MIRRLRQRHLRAFRTLTVLVPVLFVASLAARPPASASETRGAVLDSLLPPGTSLVRAGASGREPEVRRDGDALAVALPRDWTEPDVLVYWCAALPEGDDLPPGARLLGALAGKRGLRLPLPPAAGVCVLYSLAHGRVVFAAAPEEAAR